MNWGSYITSAACTVRLRENNRRGGAPPRADPPSKYLGDVKNVGSAKLSEQKLTPRRETDSNRGYRDVGSVVKNQIRPMSSKTRNTIRIKPIMPIPP
jgi:hypothetical protein